MVKTVDIRGVPHAYELTPRVDTACVLVFIHGWLLSRGYWQPAIQRLSPHYQCLSYDLRGFGDSQLGPLYPPAHSLAMSAEGDRASSSRSAAAVSRSQAAIASPAHLGYRPVDYAHDLSLLLQALNIRQAWLVGHSLGGSIALWTADLLPDLVQGVVCVNSGGGIYLKEEFERFRAAGQQLVKLRPRWLCHLPLIDLMLTRMNVARPLSRQWGRKRLLDLVMAHPEAALGTLLDSTTEAEVHCLPQVVSRLQQPVQFIAGANDDIMEPQYVRHLASFHASFQACGSNVTELPNCGHLSMVEQPDLLVSRIQDILNRYQS